MKENNDYNQNIIELTKLMLNFYNKVKKNNKENIEKIINLKGFVSQLIYDDYRNNETSELMKYFGKYDPKWIEMTSPDPPKNKLAKEFIEGMNSSEIGYFGFKPSIETRGIIFKQVAQEIENIIVHFKSSTKKDYMISMLNKKLFEMQRFMKAAKIDENKFEKWTKNSIIIKEYLNSLN